MQRWAASALTVILILWVSSPALACLAQSEKMTDAEMQCCREMAGHCGEMGVDTPQAEHSCCPKTPVKVEGSKKVVLGANEKTVIVNPLLVVFSMTLPLAAPHRERVPARRIDGGESPPGDLTPLRI